MRQNGYCSGDLTRVQDSVTHHTLKTKSWEPSVHLGRGMKNLSQSFQVSQQSSVLESPHLLFVLLLGVIRLIGRCYLALFHITIATKFHVFNFDFHFFQEEYGGWEQPRADLQNMWWCLASTEWPITFGGSTLSFPWAHATYVDLQAGESHRPWWLALIPLLLLVRDAQLQRLLSPQFHPLHSPNLYTTSFLGWFLFLKSLQMPSFAGNSCTFRANSKLRNHLVKSVFM